jgi:hypothetical protein
VNVHVYDRQDGLRPSWRSGATQRDGTKRGFSTVGSTGTAVVGLT